MVVATVRCATESYSLGKSASGAYNGKVVKFGECVLSRVKTATKGKPRWLRALWLGKTDVSDSHVVCTSSGRLVIARSIRRTTVSYDPSLLAAIRDTPDVHASFLAGRVGASRKQVNVQESEAKSPPPSGESASDSDSQKSADLDDPRELAFRSQRPGMEPPKACALTICSLQPPPMPSYQPSPSSKRPQEQQKESGQDGKRSRETATPSSSSSYHRPATTEREWQWQSWQWQGSSHEYYDWNNHYTR